MFKGVAALLVLALAGCYQAAPVPATSLSSPSVSQTLLHTWVNCARKSYQGFERSMSDRNEAAERALQACHSEEEDFRSASLEILFPHTREAVKEVLISHESF
jgi:hypothetical protein